MHDRNHKIRVLLIEQLPILRCALRELMVKAHDIEVVGETGEHTHVTTLVDQLRPEVLVMHVHAGDEDMINTIADMTLHAEAPPVLVLTSSSLESATNREVLHAGASGLIEMKETPDVLFKAICCLHAGELWIDRRTTAIVVQELRQQRNSSLKPKSGSCLLRW